MKSDHRVPGMWRTIQPAERLKALILSQAVQANLDAMHGRLPCQLRPARRRLSLTSRWTRRAALPVAVVAVLSGVGRWPFAAPAGPVVVPGETGYLFRLGEVPDLVASMYGLLSDPRVARKFGEAGRKRRGVDRMETRGR